MPSRQGSSQWKPLVVSAIAVLIFHCILVFTDLLPNLYQVWSDLFPAPKVKIPTKVSRVALSKEQWEQNRQLQGDLKLKPDGSWQKLIPPDDFQEDRTEDSQETALLEEQQTQEEKEADQKSEQQKLNGQVVDVAPTPDDTPPEDARFLSEYNTHVEKETVSRYQRKDYGIAQPHPTMAAYSKKKSDAPSDQTGNDNFTLLLRKEGQPGGSAGEPSFAFEVPDSQKHDSLKLKMDLSLGKLPSNGAGEEFEGNSDRLQIRPGSVRKDSQEGGGDGGKDKSSVALLGSKPSLDNLDMVTGAPSNDYIKGVPEGEETLLNTREFKYATFFNRVKRGVSEHWDPAEVYMQHDPYGNVYGVKDRFTVLQVELNSSGEVKDVSIGQTSGLNFLDEEAVQAFHDASPFPNPPAGLVDTEGKIRFQFGFYFEIGERPHIRGFSWSRYPD